MRLDRMLTSTGLLSRSEAAKAARGGRLTVNDKVIRDATLHIDPERDIVKLDGEIVVYRKFHYIMLNKPKGYVSATEDGRDPTVLELLPEQLQRLDLFPCGRLDKNTLGLMLLTDNGELAHRLLSPRRHVTKEYRFECRREVSDAEKEELESGITLADGYTTLECEIELDEDRLRGLIRLHEGKYHQIKRMFGAAGDNRIIYLERVSFGPLKLDPTLGRGEWRYLTDDEIKELEKL